MSNLLVKHNRSFSPVRLPCRPDAWRGQLAGCVAKMKVSIVIRYDEKDTIEKVIKAVRNAPLNM
jgi:hypothetical protein